MAMPVLLWLLLLWLPPSSAATADWLTATDDAHATATVTVDADGVIALSNGTNSRSDGAVYGVFRQRRRRPTPSAAQSSGT